MNELTYRRSGDYLIPNLTLSGMSGQTIGKYGRMRKRFLEEHRPILYSSLLLTGRLQGHLAETDWTAREWMERMLPEMMRKAGVNERLKAENQMRWVGLMNALKQQAEEIVLDRLICA